MLTIELYLPGSYTKRGVRLNTSQRSYCHHSPNCEAKQGENMESSKPNLVIFQLKEFSCQLNSDMESNTNFLAFTSK